MSKVLVTGGCGLIGDQICSSFLAKGYEVVAVDRKQSNYNLNKARFTFCQASPVEKVAYADIMERYHFDIVIHLACTADNDLDSIITDSAIKENDKCNEFIYQLALAHEVKQFILISTTQVYQIPKFREPLHEDDFLKPVTNYAKLKMASEQRLSSEIGRRPDMTVAIFRIAPIYTKEFCANLEAKITDPKDKTKFIYQSGEYSFHMCCLHNLVDFLLTFVQMAFENHNLTGVYNVADKHPIMASEIIEYMKKYHRLGIVLQKNTPNANLKMIQNMIGSKEMKTNYRFLDLTKIMNNTMFDTTKAAKLCSFKWNIHNLGDKDKNKIK
ncbi:MAG: NAD(P)-dependent oxidoreductase [Oscillospiraceae bacterium]|nr:NAD(P)-dependent oxidoreductase [Oscillospiraceae bacterium]